MTVHDALLARLLAGAGAGSGGEEGGGSSGGGSEPLVVAGSYDAVTNTLTLNKTWNEIHSAFPNVYIATDEINYATIGGLFVHTGDADSGYYVVMINTEMGGSMFPILLKASSGDGYPSYTE